MLCECKSAVCSGCVEVGWRVIQVVVHLRWLQLLQSFYLYWYDEWIWYSTSYLFYVPTIYFLSLVTPPFTYIHSQDLVDTERVVGTPVMEAALTEAPLRALHPPVATLIQGLLLRAVWRSSVVLATPLETKMSRPSSCKPSKLQLTDTKALILSGRDVKFAFGHKKYLVSTLLC